MDTIKKSLDEVISAKLEDLKNLDPTSQEYQNAIDDLQTLYKLKLAEDELELKRNSASSQEDEKEILEKERKIDRWLKFGLGCAEIGLPLMFYGVWMRRGFRFEEKGTISSDVFRRLIGHFKPTMRR